MSIRLRTTLVFALLSKGIKMSLPDHPSQTHRKPVAPIPDGKRLETLPPVHSGMIISNLYQLSRCGNT